MLPFAPFKVSCWLVYGGLSFGVLLLAVAGIETWEKLSPGFTSLVEPYTRIFSVALRNQLFYRLELPAPLVFFPVAGIVATLLGITSAYFKNNKLRDRISRLVDEIQGFRLESQGKRPVLVRNPSTGKINLWQAQAMMDYQKRDHAGYLAKFRYPLAELAKEIARYGLSTEKDLIAAFFGTQDISSVEKQLLSFAEQIGRPKRVIGWHAAKVASFLAVLVTITWALLVLASHAHR
jgi:hypothetical protein